MKNKKQNKGIKLSDLTLDEIQSVEILIDEDEQVYEGMAVTTKDGVVFPFKPSEVIFQEASDFLNEFEKFKTGKEIPNEDKLIQIEKGDLFQIKNKQTNKIFSVVVIELAKYMNSKEEITFEVIKTGETIRIYSDELLKEYDVKRIEKIDSFEKPKKKAKQEAFNLAIEERLLNDIRDGKIESIYYHMDDSKIVDGINIVYKKEFEDKEDTIDCVLGSPETSSLIMTTFKEYKCKPTEPKPEEKKSEPKPAPEKVITAKNMEYTHKLTPVELVKIADEQNNLIEENINLENKLEGYKNEINPQIKSNEKKITELHRQYTTKIVTRTETIEPDIDWKKGVMKYLHPETKAVLEQLPIPKDLRQQKIDFGKDGKATKKEWVINKKFDPDKLMMLQWGIFRLLFSNYDKPKEFLNMFIGLMPATAANIRLHVKNSVDSHHGFGGPASDGKPSYSFDSEPSGLTLKYQIGDKPREVIKGKELCRAAADILNMIIIQPDFEEYIELEHEPEPKPDDTTKEFYFEYCKMYQGVDFPKGVTPTRIDKIKDDIINSDFFEELCFFAKKDGSRNHQSECAKNFFDHCSDVLKSKGIIKI